MKKLIGYIACDFADNEPMHGTRRFKVWSTELECLRKHGLLNNTSNRYGSKPIYVEVAESV